MPPQTTKIAAAMDALAAQLAPRLAPVPVSVGAPHTLESEHVWVTGNWESRQSWGSLGQGVRDELLNMAVAISVQRSTDNYAEVRDRALELLAEVEEELREDDSLGGVVRDAEMTSYRGFHDPQANAQLVTIEASVEARARLST